jgi:formate/nitrite transporter FocA (FNT family)
VRKGWRPRWREPSWPERSWPFMSSMLEAVDRVVARALLAYLVGFLLALGPFDHVVVSTLHVLFGVWDSDAVGYTDLFTNIGLAAAGNLAGGLLLITLTHTAQVTR